MIGEIIAPKIIPNLNQSTLSGVKSFEFINPKIKKTAEIMTDQILIDPSWVRGHRLTIKNTTKNTNPKLLFDEIFILEFNVMFISFIQNSLETTFSKLMLVIST